MNIHPTVNVGAFHSVERDVWGAELASVCGRKAEWGFLDEPFEGKIEVREVGGIKLVDCQHNLREMRQDCASSQGVCKYVMFVMQMHGSCEITQSSRLVKLAVDDVGIIDGFSPFECRFRGPSHQLIAYLPAYELANAGLIDVLASPLRIAADEAIGCLARSTIWAMTRSTVDFDEEDAAFARQMLSNVVQHSLRSARKAQAVACDTRMLPERRIREYVDANLTDPSLSPAKIANGCGVSVRQVHRSFQNTEWSARNWIKKRRLDFCRSDLLNPAVDESISQIAFRWGFNEAAHFSRSFKEYFGMSPREFRGSNLNRQ